MGQANYSSSKAGLIGLTKATAATPIQTVSTDVQIQVTVSYLIG
jgi:NAD(P)-dependent dehydrogenase (short-subunit alcohol dehydrogenase family)